MSKNIATGIISCYTRSMIPGGSAEGENRPNPTVPSLRDFFNQTVPQMKEDITSFGEGAEGTMSMPFNHRFIFRIRDVGENHLRFLHDHYGTLASGTIPNVEEAKESIAAVVLGISFFALQTSIEINEVNELGQHIFDNTTFFKQLDYALHGVCTYNDIYFHKYPDAQAYEVFDENEWKKLSRSIEAFGPNLFDGRMIDLLPQSMQGLIHGLNKGEDVYKLAENISLLLNFMEDTKENDHTIIDFTDFRQKTPNSQSGNQDAGLRDLLRGIPGFGSKNSDTGKSHVEDSNAISDPDAQWNRRDWFDSLFKDKQ